MQKNVSLTIKESYNIIQKTRAKLWVRADNDKIRWGVNAI